ncbi:MAG: hypothetical protein Q7S40_20375 [Opitutaceae bacterium]|nr:hypothetical protein [Opitutaceae bacterium]
MNKLPLLLAISLVLPGHAAPERSNQRAAAEARIEASKEFRSFVANVRIGEVRSGSVYLNDRLYRVGDLIDVPLGITLLSIDLSKKQLWFEDRIGARVGRKLKQ